jgi:hypothetical protein
MIINKDNRLPAPQVAKLDPEKFSHSLAVGKIINKKTKNRGTAFRIGPGNHMMTNAHVMKSGDPRDYRIEFTDAKGQVTSVDGDKLLAFSPRPEKDMPRPYNKSYLDFALFTIDPSQFESVKQFGHLELDVEGAKTGQNIYIPQYGKFDRKNIKTIAVSEDAEGIERPSQIKIVYPENSSDTWSSVVTVNYSADTTKGSSGSPVISADTHKVVALHNGPSTKPGANAAANMSTIWQEIKGFFSKPAPATPSMAQHQVADQHGTGSALFVVPGRNRGRPSSSAQTAATTLPKAQHHVTNQLSTNAAIFTLPGRNRGRPSSSGA